MNSAFVRCRLHCCCGPGSLVSFLTGQNREAGLCRSGDEGGPECLACQQSSNPRRSNHALATEPDNNFPSSTRHPGAATAGHPLNPKLLSGKRKTRKRSLCTLNQDMVDPPLEARGHVRGAKEMSRGGSTNAREQLAAQHFGRLAGIRSHNQHCRV